MSTSATASPRRKDAPPARPQRRGRGPLWAKLMLAAGIVLMLFSTAAIVGGAVVNTRYGDSVDRQNLLPPDENRPDKIDRDRPFNLLLVGIDSRPDSQEPVRGDSIIIVHVPKGHAEAYLLSLPRDLLVEIPPSPPGRRRATHEKLNAAFPYGSENGRGIEGGFQLLSRTITRLVGITFDGAAVINFDGFRAVVRELGGVTMCIDHKIVSEHMGDGPDGKYLHPRDGGEPWVYLPGCHRLDDWHALDLVRQRKSLPDGDYGRQRNQQRFLKAMLDEAKSKNVITDPRRIDAIIRAAGKALTLDDNGISVIEWAWSLRGIDASSVVMVRTPGHGVGTGSAYQGEELDPVGDDLLDALAGNQLAGFMATHPELINQR